MKMLSFYTVLATFISMFFGVVYAQTPNRVTCYFSADNEVVKVYVNGVDVTGDVKSLETGVYDSAAMKDFTKVKYHEFDEPNVEVSSYAFMLKEAGTASPGSSGFLMGCVTSKSSGPWHRLVSNYDANIWSGFSSQSSSSTAFPTKQYGNVYNTFPDNWYLSSVKGTSTIARAYSPFNCVHEHCSAGRNQDFPNAPLRLWTSDESALNFPYFYAGLRATIVKEMTNINYCKHSNIDQFVQEFNAKHYCKFGSSKEICKEDQYGIASFKSLEYRTCTDTKTSFNPTCTYKSVSGLIHQRISQPEKCYCSENADDDEYYDLISPSCSATSKMVSIMYCNNWEYNYNDDWAGDTMTKYFSYSLSLFFGFDLNLMRCDDADNCYGEFCPNFGTFNDPDVVINTPTTKVIWDQCTKRCPYGYYCNKDTIGKCANGYICDKALCSGNYYCELGNVPRPCSSGCYCPMHPDLKVSVELNCGPGNYCPQGSTKPTICTVGNFCGENSGSPAYCQKGTYCLISGLPYAPLCPPGYHCPVGGNSLPLPCTKDQSCNYAWGSTTRIKCNNGGDCDRFLISWPVEESDLGSVYDTPLGVTTKVKMVDYAYNGKKITIQSTSQLIIDAFRSGSFLNSWLDLSSSVIDVSGRLILKNVNVVAGKINLLSKGVLVLENSSITLNNIIISSGSNNDASIIILRGSSHLMGVKTKLGGDGVLRYDIPSNAIIEFEDDALASIIGCDSMPSCDSAPFLNLTKSSPWRNIISEFASDTTSSVPASKILTSVGNSQEKRKMVIKSFIGCAASNEGIHKPSTYLSRALYCAAKDTSTQFDSSQIFKEVASNIGYIVNVHNLDSNEKDLLEQIRQVALERTSLNGVVVSSGFAVVPRLSLEFLVGSKGPKRGTIDYLLDSFEQIDSNINSISSSISETVNTLETMKSKDLSDRLRQYSIAKAQAETGKLVAQAQIDAANEAMTILINRGKNTYLLADSLTKQLLPTLQAAYDEIESEMELNWFDLIVGIFTIATQVASAAASFYVGDVAGGVTKSLSAVTGTITMISGIVDKKDKDYKDLLTSESLKYIGQIFDNLDGTLNEMSQMENNIKNRINDQRVGFNLPKTRWRVISDLIIAEVMGAGCDEFDPEDVPSCGKFRDLVNLITEVHMELSDTTNSLIDLIQTREISEIQLGRYDKLMKSWSEKYISEEYSQELLGATFLAQIGGQIADAQKLLQASLSRVQLYSLTMVRNGIEALNSLCRAASYYNPLNYNNPKWKDLCETPISSKITLLEIKKKIEDFLLSFGEMPDPQNYQDISIEVTNLIDLKKFKSDIEKAGINENPSISFVLTPNLIPNTNILYCTENIALQWVGFYITGKSSGALSIPNPTSLQIKLNNPFIKKVGGKEYFFDFKEKTYDISYAPGDTINTLYEPSASDLLDTFARPSPFARYTVTRRAGKLFDASSDYRAWLLIKYTGTSVQNCNTGTDCTQLSKSVCTAGIGCIWVKNKCQALVTKSPVKSPTKKPVNSPTKKPISAPTKKPIIPLSQVTCKFVVDDNVVEFWVNGVDLTSKIIGNLNGWEEVREITFEVPTKYPQVLSILGSDNEDVGSSAISGLSLQCTSNNAPKWNFTSRPGTGWKAISSNSLPLIKGWNLSKPVKGEVIAIKSTSGFGLEEADPDDKLWGPGNFKYVGLKKVIT